MTGTALTPAGGPPVTAAAPSLDECAALLKIWDHEIEETPTDQLRDMLELVILAIRADLPSRLVKKINTPARRADIAVAVDRLVTAFSARKDANLGPFSKLLAEEILAAHPTAVAVREGIGQLVREAVHPPAVAEVLAAIAGRGRAWEAQASLLDRLPRRTGAALAELRRRQPVAP